MDNNTAKSWYKSKTNVAGIVTFLLGVYQFSRPIITSIWGTSLPEIPDSVIRCLEMLLGVTIVYGRSTAKSVIK